MDYDDDGILDMISGSYDPGDLYLFRGLGKGEYAARQLLRDEKGVPLVHHPVQLAKYQALQKKTGKKYVSANGAIQLRVASFGSWPAMVDWDADGDLDMLIGTFSGRMYLRMNKGTRKKPVFDAESLQVHAGGKALKVNSHANPVVADWDGDGRWDLVVGAADGAVVWYRNEGTSTEPKFGASQELLPALSDNKFVTQFLDPDQAVGRGVRSQICVTDYNGDGKLDLIVGDYSAVCRRRSDLSEEQVAELREVSRQEAALRANLGRRNKTQRQKVNKLTKKKSAFYGKSRKCSFVWLFLRK